MRQNDEVVLPDGWEIKKLKEVANYFIGLTYSPKDIDDKGTVVLRSSNVQNDVLDFADIVRVSKSIKEGLKVMEGDILMCSRNGSKRLVGKTATITGLNEEMTFGTFMTVIRSPINPYLAWFFKSDQFRDQLGIGEYTMINQVTKYMLNEISLPIPPLSEQHRIVAILNGVFEAIAMAKANAEQNLKNSKELFESYLQGVFENKGEGWEEKTLKEITTLLGDGLHGTPKYTEDGDYHFINGNNLKDGVIEFKTSTKRVSIEEYDKYKKNLTNRTVMVSINGTLGNVAFYNNEKIILGKSACYFNMKDSVDKSYIKYVLSSPYFLLYAHKQATGATIKNVSLKTMREFIVPLPSLKEQQTIVQKLDALSIETKRLEAIYQQKINDLEELKKSVLQKAFAGELKEDLKEHYAENA